MKHCAACGAPRRTGTRALIVDRATIRARARSRSGLVCRDCAKGAILLVVTDMFAAADRKTERLFRETHADLADLSGLESPARARAPRERAPEEPVAELDDAAELEALERREVAAAAARSAELAARLDAAEQNGGDS